jgi:monovalent cation:H+ antiporter-2, CPA2 family
MLDPSLVQVLLLLGLAVAVVWSFQRLTLPSSLAYLLVGVILGPYTIGPVIERSAIEALAQFGIVFLLFSIGLNFSLPQLQALRNQILGLGTAQIVITTAVIGVLAWLAGLSPAAAFVVGAVFAQSSTTIISRQLAEQAEDQSRHGRLGIAMSVFQDVTAVPFIVVIPALGVAAASAAHEVLPSLAMALAKALLAFAAVVLVGRRILRRLFQLVAARNSTELFTLTVLFVSLAAAATTSSLGLSLAFGAFLAGMTLGETEFRHQTEATIRPFRDVLLGLFFVSIGMLFNPSALPDIWAWALAGMAALLVAKTVLVAQIVRLAQIDPLTSWRTGLVLAVGGEFGFALLAIALGAGVIGEQAAQIALASVLFSMVAAPFLIRYNHTIATWFAQRPSALERHADLRATPEGVGVLRGHVIICGYGRIGQSVGHFLEEEKIPYVALDLDPARVREARQAGEKVFYADAADRNVLENVGLAAARLLVVSYADVAAAHRILQHVRVLRPELPVMVRTRDDTHVDELRAAGATEVVPESLEAGLMIATHVLLLLDVPPARLVRQLREQRSDRYRLLRELFRGESPLLTSEEERDADRLRPVILGDGSHAVGRTLAQLPLDGVVITALVRAGERQLTPPRDTSLQAGDTLVLFGAPDDLERVAARLQRGTP